MSSPFMLKITLWSSSLCRVSFVRLRDRTPTIPRWLSRLSRHKVTLASCALLELSDLSEATAAPTAEARFVDPSSGAALSTGTVDSLLVSFISLANLRVKARALDTRKYAGPLA